MFQIVSHKISLAIVVLGLMVLTGCASVPMASQQQDELNKAFADPSSGKAGLYVYRNSFVGKALKKTISFDGVVIGETANKVYFYKEISPGSHTLSTESEFSDNSVSFEAEEGKNYFARQYIKMGVFVGGAGVEMVSEEEGERNVLQCKQAKEFQLENSAN